MPAAAVTFKCAICLDFHCIEDVFLPHGAEASASSAGPCCLCRPCAREAFKQAISQRSFPLRCPICIASSRSDAIREGLADEVICGVLSEEEQSQFHQQRFEAWQDQSPDVRACPTADCKGVGFLEDGRCHCSLCDVDWCGLCNQMHTADITCEAYAEWQRDNNEGEERFDALANAEKMRACPRCGHMVQKESGCNHMTCRCREHFCYICGQSLDEKDPYSHFNQPPDRNPCPLFDGQEEEVGHQLLNERRVPRHQAPPEPPDVQQWGPPLIWGMRQNAPDAQPWFQPQPPMLEFPARQQAPPEPRWARPPIGHIGLRQHAPDAQPWFQQQAPVPVPVPDPWSPLRHDPPVQLPRRRQQPQEKGGKAKGKHRVVECYNCGGDHFARDCPDHQGPDSEPDSEEGKGKGKGKGKRPC
eukprot:TRINITY_DN95175_c0_g1_i1.p1 TRINITY_DN95175_c0_g1~~TRINITY_DN95175_c0_g1_i1.p1  ORF type:complete len:422 (-),score=58.40 TRINITY_DN95175_c0_g1_i1:178-1422(-)